MKGREGREGGGMRWEEETRKEKESKQGMRKETKTRREGTQKIDALVHIAMYR